MNDYTTFLNRKLQLTNESGFKPLWIPDFLFDFQKYLTDWSIRMGRAALFEDCGLGKTPQQLVWAENVVRKTNKPVIVSTPLAVSHQTIREAEKFGIDAKRSRDGKIEGGARIWVTNYEQLEKFDSSQFAGFVGDESSGIKHYDTRRRAVVSEFCRTISYRLLCTATAAPNDYFELGTSSDALGYLGFRDMITKFFVQETKQDYLGWGRTKYRFRGHAERPFWRWVCSWARAIRKPSDIGFSDRKFQLPKLIEKEIVVKCHKPREGMLVPLPAESLQEQREEARLTLTERCEAAAEIMNGTKSPVVAWCHLNPEADRLEKLVPDALQISGSMSDEKKEERMVAFSSGQLRALVIKPKIGCWGLNWQHCSDVVMFPSHSYEQYYQAIRRCLRFGQKNNVTVNIINTDGQLRMMQSLKRKADQADAMFTALVEEMSNELQIQRSEGFTQKERIPAWLS